MAFDRVYVTFLDIQGEVGREAEKEMRQKGLK
jgi:hypothetical protein